MKQINLTTLLVTPFVLSVMLLGLTPAVAAAHTTTSVPWGTTTVTGTGNPGTPLTTFATNTGGIDYVAAGAAMRDYGYGSITLTWSGPVVAAYLVWSVMPPGSGLNTGMLNGVPVTGSFVGSDTGPCWGPPSINTYIASVPPGAVINGVNSLTGFASGISTGANPQSNPGASPLLEGASLIVIFNSGGPTREVKIYTGALTAFGGTLTSTFPHSTAATTSAKTTYIVSDGQLPGNQAFWNSLLIDPNAFPGSDPRPTPTPTWTNGPGSPVTDNLYDTKTYTVPISTGSISESAAINGFGGDCVTWNAQVLRVDTALALPRPTSTVVNCSPGTVPVNVATTCTATVTDIGPGIPVAPTGSVTFTSSGSGLFSSLSCTLAPISSSASQCSVSYTPNPGSEGTHNITGTYPGDPNHSGSAGTFALTVIKRTTSTTVSCNPNLVPINTPTTCTATVTDTSVGITIAPTGPVFFLSSGPGTFSSTSCTLSPISSFASQCSVTFTPGPGSAGPDVITATYGGDTDHFSSSGSTTITVTKRSTTTTVNCSPMAVTVKQATTCIATVTDTSPGTKIAPTGSVSFTSSKPGVFTSTSCVLSMVSSSASSCSVTYTPLPGSEGVHIITATYTGDIVHSGSSGMTTLTVTKQPTITTVSCNPSPVAVNQPTSCTATVTDTSPGPAIPPTGSVSFTSNGSGIFFSSSCNLSPISSRASSCVLPVSYTPNPGSEGTHTITGTYGGDIDHSGSSGTFPLIVTKRTTSTSVSCSPNFVQPGVSTTCQATVTDTSPGTPLTPTGTVTWTTNATGTFSPSNSCTLSGTGPSASCTVTYTPTSQGTHQITATYQGDTDHFGSSGSTNLAVGVPPRSAVTNSSLCYFDQDPNVFGQQFTLIFIEDPANPGTYKLTASNPGQFYYNVFYNGPAGSPVSLAIRIPYPFVTQGSVPVQEFSQVSFNSQGCFVPSGQLSGFTVTGTPTTTPSGATSITLSDYTPQAMGSFVTLTVSGTVPSTGLVYVTIHLDYGLKGDTGYVDTNNNAVNPMPSQTIPQLQSYSFNYNTLVGNPTQFDSQAVQSENVFKGCGMGFCGMVMDSTGTPVNGATVQVYSSTGLLLGTVQTDQYGFYTIPYTLLGTNLATFTIEVPAYNLQQTVTLAANTFTVTNFTTP